WAGPGGGRVGLDSADSLRALPLERSARPLVRHGFVGDPTRIFPRLGRADPVSGGTRVQAMNDVDLSRYINLILKWLWLILISTALASGTAYRASKLLPATYRAAVTVQVGDDVSNPNLSPDDVARSQRIAGGYAAMVQRQQILEATARALNLSVDWRTLRD